MNNNSARTKKIIRIALWTVFSIYCLVLIKILFLDRFGHEFVSFGSYLKTHTNFVPFKTIISYFELLSEDRINTGTVVINLLANILLFLPMGMVLPCLFGKLQKFWTTVVTVLGVILATEVVQLVFQLGSFDIDDFILNISGAMFGYSLIRIPLILSLLKKTYIYPQ